MEGNIFIYYQTDIASNLCTIVTIFLINNNFFLKGDFTNILII